MTFGALETKKMLAAKIRARESVIRDWYMRHAEANPPPFYCSIDLRDSGHKIVPVDSNLFPAGFNNICSEDIRTAPAILREWVEGISESGNRAIPKRILVIPESHTQNTYYIENLYYLLSVIREAGFEAALGWYGPVPEGASERIELRSVTDKALHAEPTRIEGGTIQAGEFVPDLILLNNDFSMGYPKELDAVTQPIVPSYKLGWHSRKKSGHFVHYNRLAGEFASLIGIDPWMIQIETTEVPAVNFNEDQGIERVAQAVQSTLDHMTSAYRARGITHAPFAFVKNNAGTYGMGIMVVHSGEELLKMNRRTKNKMSVGKNRLPIHSVVVQEGVPTATIVDRLAAEPVIYLFGCELIGGFLRTNTERGVEDNLNSQGMVFRKLCMSDLRHPDFEEGEMTAEDEPLLELVYGSIARISALAAGFELRACLQD